mmetsp:Transcript_29559/g.60946  ORF Transcript_29559/g.60946 Transcript_29559/m.60946 type:complete len:88 (-) Transcript_29559:50-313(-)
MNKTHFYCVRSRHMSLRYRSRKSFRSFHVSFPSVIVESDQPIKIGRDILRTTNGANIATVSSARNEVIKKVFHLAAPWKRTDVSIRE